MKGFRFTFALWSAKAAQFVLRLAGRKATYAAGKLAIRLCPDFLSCVGRPETLVGVTGTNGKTTVSNLLSDMLEQMGEDVVSNRYGSNIDAGVATALIDAADLSGRCRKRLGVLEMDERSAARIFPALKPDYLVVTNLFRDSMRRNAHPEYIASLLEQNIPAAAKLVLNADDPISSSLAPLNSRVFFGIDPLPDEPPVRENLVQDVRLCPVCGDPVAYEFRRYHHIGQARCDACGWHSRKADYSLISVDRDADLMTVLESEDGQDVWQEYPVLADAVYNLYNELSAIALLRELGCRREQIADALGKVSIVRSRYWTEQLGRWTLTEIMAKGLNAVACSRNFDYVANAPGRKSVVLLLDDVFDEKSSSENIAWLYDADFEFLAAPEITQVVAMGVRAQDTCLRLLIAGVSEERITLVKAGEDPAQAVRLADCDSVFVLYEVYREKQAVALRNRIGERMKQA